MLRHAFSLFTELTMRGYRQVNRVLAVAALAGLLLPLAAPWLYRTFPWVYPGCWFRRVAGRPCPLCGMTRAVAVLLRGRLDEATALHPLVHAAVALLAAEALFRLLLAILPLSNARLSRIMARDATLHTWLAGAFLVYGIGHIVTVLLI